MGLEAALKILKQHFTFTAAEIAAAYQKSNGYALAAITAGLAAPKQKLAFLQQLTRSKVSREFSAQIESHYFQPFAAQQGVSGELALKSLRQQLIEPLKVLAKRPLHLEAEDSCFTEAELAELIHEQGDLAITDLVLEQIAPVDETLAAFLCYEELLGNAILFFWREIIRQDSRTKTTLETLQREGLWADVRDIKAAQQQLTVLFQQKLDAQNAKAMQALQDGDFLIAGQITPQLQSLKQSLEALPNNLQAAQVAWQRSQQNFMEFSQRFATWANLLDSKVEQVLVAMETLQGTIIKIDENVETLLQEFRQFMQRFDLSNQLKAGDEFTHHSSRSLELIQTAALKLKRLPNNYQPQYNQLVIMAGTVLSSTGETREAEKLFEQARKITKNSAEKALASFNLFQIRLWNRDYPQALADLQTAISIDAPRYALHDVDRYPIIRLLGAGGMGCVFLCHDQWRENQRVVKCFWEGRKGSREDVFGEAMKMRKIAGDYVPKPLDCGYVDSTRQEHPYFVTEYIEGALDGEAWLAQHGKLAVATGIAVGLQIAQGLQVAHSQGIYHLDLKPANLLFKSTKTGLMVKIIDFGLARVANSLRAEAMSLWSLRGLSQFGQAIVAGTYDYAPPEQLGETKYGKPSGKSDLYAFGATLYRLMTGESPRHLNPRRLASAPPALFELLCDCKEDNPKQRPQTAEVIARLTDLLSKKKPEPKKKREPGDIFRDHLKNGSEGPEMVVIAAGRFHMGDIRDTGGDDDEKPVHEVSVNSFAMGRYPVTVGEFKQFVEATSYKTEAETGDGAYIWNAEKQEVEKPEDANWRKPYFSQTDNHPVVCVSWNDAVAYAEWLSAQTGQQYRLSTEAEWEYAARAGTETDYWWGNEIGKNRANCYDSGSKWSNKSTSPVGSFEANPFGLYDTVGNAWEWCADNWHENYEGAPSDGRIWKGGDESLRVLRGGSWYLNPSNARAAYRLWNDRSNRSNRVGFRVAARNS
jgi:formylglycine-generating enzyme required for sulfatase activity/tetratricopeptide (TPR) repeat protein